MQYLFVYGTLKRAFTNEFALFLFKNATFIAEAYVFGKIFEVEKYPGAILNNEKSSKIWGEIYIIKSHFESFIKVMDEYEEYGEKFPKPNEYIRKKVKAFSQNQTYECWFYEYNLDFKDLKLIESGKY